MSSPVPTPRIFSGRLARVADVAFRRRRAVLAAWIAALVLTAAGGGALAGEFEANVTTPDSDSERASELIAERFPGVSGDAIDVVWQARGGVRQPDVSRRMTAFLAEAGGLEGIGAAGRPAVSNDGTIAIARLQLDRREWDVPVETGEALIDRARAASGDGLRVELGGPLGGPIQEAEGGGSPEGIGLIAAAVILLVAFGSVVAAGLPLATALFGLGISTALIGVLAAVVDVPEFAPQIAGVLGIGVGIDYALLIVTRFRGALDGGAEPRAAAVEAVTTAGRSVLIAGGTVVISMLGLFFVGVSYMNGVALAASLSVLVVMLASVTLLPALLGFAGRRVDRLRIPGLARGARPAGDGLAAHWSRIVQRRPWRAALAGAAILLALTAPVLGLRFGFPDAGNNREGTTTRAAYDLVAQGFGSGANGPLLLAAELREPGAAGEVRGIADRLRSEPGVASVSAPRVSADGRGAMLSVIPATSPQDTATNELVERLRDDTLPELTAGTGVTIAVGGTTASFLDQSDLLGDRLPLFIAGVVGLSFVLLLAAFRAPVIALKAGLMNLLSVGAAYGVVALFAEGGFFGQLIGIGTDTPVPAFVPVIMFAILFGLSMDYEVFLLSRVREEYLGHRETGRAVVNGLAKTARVITAAAAIMVAVQLSFATSPESFLKLTGLGMATAVFVDATVVRMLLVPAVMQLLGRANWWIPRWLDRALPRLDVEPRVAAERSEA